MSTIAVSIIVPLFNTEQYIERCLNSLIKQTLMNIEIIVINDGSTDASMDIVNRYLLKHSQIHIIDKKCEGAGLARNIGIEIARGDFIGFVDSDDWVQPEMFERLYDSAMETNSDIAVCAYRRFYNESKNELPMHANDVEIWQECLEKYGDKPFALNEYPRFLMSINYAWRKIYRKVLFDENGIRFAGTSMSNDVPVHWKTLMFAKSISLVDEALYNYRLGRGEQLIRIKDNRLFDVFDIYREMDDFFRLEQEYSAYAPYFLRRKMYDFDWIMSKISKELRKEFFSRMQKMIHGTDKDVLRAYHTIYKDNRLKEYRLAHYLHRTYIIFPIVSVLSNIAYVLRNQGLSSLIKMLIRKVQRKYRVKSV